MMAVEVQSRQFKHIAHKSYIKLSTEASKPKPQWWEKAIVTGMMENQGWIWAQNLDFLIIWTNNNWLKTIIFIKALSHHSKVGFVSIGFLTTL